MTQAELIKYKSDYNSKIAVLKIEFQINQLTSIDIEKKQAAILDEVFKAIDDHEKVCEEFDRNKE